MQQLPLGVQLGVSMRFETYHEGANGAALAGLRQLARETGRSSSALWVHGPAGVGKTHLLQACCAFAGQRGLTSAYLPLQASKDLVPGLLAGLERVDLVALDDVDAIAGHAAWEQALFTLYNELMEQGGRLACSAQLPPAGVAFNLPDLASRLSACVVHRLQPITERDQGPALRRRAEHRGLELPDETLSYLTRRAPRDFATLCRLLDELDTEALAAQRRLTVPFVRQVLERSD
ncbi:MAG: DnaA regulatory inactivator Hda [Steroidobacteraceae bacterium]